MSVNPAQAVALGVDLGTLSARAVVVRVADGAELGSALQEEEHAHGVVDHELPRQRRGVAAGLGASGA